MINNNQGSPRLGLEGAFSHQQVLFHVKLEGYSCVCVTYLLTNWHLRGKTV